LPKLVAVSLSQKNHSAEIFELKERRNAMQVSWAPRTTITAVTSFVILGATLVLFVVIKTRRVVKDVS
jgi:hypothetical protein